uniref:Selenoprotein O n=1 Tax=Hemiselmis andersenii TaxID=464988 RepID=A0A6T8K5B8_HEMAN
MAMCYGGHQFGNWAGQLGDGRAMSLGEVINSKGERWELQLKGAGPTPYSRTADGRAVLRSSVREYLCSEAMYHLGVPTTRALSLVLTGDEVIRDMFYDGNAKPEPGAVVCRVAPSFIRFGNFELPASRGDEETLLKLLDYTLQRDFPAISAKFSGADAYVELLKEVCRTTALMTAHWMRVGYVHGVMNTDNMSILGLTIDYGPYGWVDNYDPEWTPNTTDGMRGRYKFGNQPGVSFWNLVRLANALYPAVKDVEPLQEALVEFEKAMTDNMSDMHRQKLGLAEWRGEEDEKLYAELCKCMEKQETDMTILFRKLGDLAVKEGGVDEGGMLDVLQDAFYKPLKESTEAEWKSWLSKYAKRVKEDDVSDAERRQAMNKANPKYVLRNFIAQQAIDAAADAGDFSLVQEVLEVMRRPYDEQSKEMEAKYFIKRPDWARTKPGCSALSCSS